MRGSGRGRTKTEQHESGTGEGQLDIRLRLLGARRGRENTTLGRAAEAKRQYRLVFVLVAVDGEVPHLVGRLVRGDDVQVVAQLLLLQVLLREVLEVALGEGQLGRDDDLRLVDGQRDRVAEVARLAADLSG